MNIWIATTGNSDVQLITDDNWSYLYEKERFNREDSNREDSNSEDSNRQELSNQDFELTSLDVDNYEDIYTAPARVLGIVYGKEFENHWEDLVFPLFDGFSKKLKDEPKLMPDKIILLLTDQSNLYSDYTDFKNSPCWKDTRSLLPILKHYFSKNFPKARLEHIVLKPMGKKGLDNWDSVLDLVQKELSELKFKESDVIYVSHQAGTPAVSSAVQFVTLSNFGQRVKFLVANEYEKDSVEIIDSSKYLRGISIQQAKSLVPTSPGAAKKLLEKIEDVDGGAIAELNNKIDFFNLNRVVNSNGDDFSIPAATQRIIDVLDLISIFFAQENYLQGITLISAAQETFLKVAILSKIKEMSIVVEGKTYPAQEFFEWKEKGLLFNPEKYRLENLEKEDICEKLLATENIIKNINREIKKIKKTTGLPNYIMFEWLQELEPAFVPKLDRWPLLKWSCKDKKEGERRGEIDLRNQLVHNLRGMKKSDVVEYLMGYQKVETDNVIKIYNEKVKQPFFEALRLFKLDYTRDKLDKELKDLAKSLS